MNELKVNFINTKVSREAHWKWNRQSDEPRCSALKNVSKQTCEPVITYVSTHNPQNPELFNVIKFNLPVLQEDLNMNDILSNFKVIKSKQQPNNLKKTTNQG